MIRFSCGCIGFPSRIIVAPSIDGYREEVNLPPIRLVDCRGNEGDHQDSEYGAHFSPGLGGKTPYETLTLVEAKSVLKKIQGLISDGIKLNEIKSLLS